MNFTKPTRHELTRLAFEAEVARRLRAAALDVEYNLVFRYVETLLPVLAVVGERCHVIDEDGHPTADTLGVVTVLSDGASRLILDECGGWYVVEGGSAPDGTVLHRDLVSTRYVVRRYDSDLILRRLFSALISAIEQLQPDCYDQLHEQVVAVGESFAWFPE